MKNVRLVVPVGVAAAASYLKEATAAPMPDVYVALLELALKTLPLTDLVGPVGNLIDARARAKARSVMTPRRKEKA